MSQAGSFVTGTSPATTYTLTPDQGDVVSPLSNNINISGDGTSVITVGDSGTATISIEALPLLFKYTNVSTTPYVVLDTDYYLSVNTAAPITIQLPDTTSINRLFVIKDRSGTANTNNITVTTVSGIALIDGAAIYTMNSTYQSVSLVFNGTNYEIF